MARSPPSRAASRTWTMPSAISGISVSNRRTRKPGMGPREQDLRALDPLLDLEHVGPDAVARIVALAGDLLALHEHRLGLADLDDHVPLLDAVDDAPDDPPFLVDELRVDGVALGVAHPLQDHLLGRLGGDATELLRGQLHLELVLELGLAVELARLVEADLELLVGDRLHDLLPGEDAEVARVAVELHPDIVGQRPWSSWRRTRAQTPPPRREPPCRSPSRGRSAR